MNNQFKAWLGRVVCIPNSMIDCCFRARPWGFVRFENPSADTCSHRDISEREQSCLHGLPFHHSYIIYKNVSKHVYLPCRYWCRHFDYYRHHVLCLQPRAGSKTTFLGACVLRTRSQRRVSSNSLLWTVWLARCELLGTLAPLVHGTKTSGVGQGSGVALTVRSWCFFRAGEYAMSTPEQINLVLAASDTVVASFVSGNLLTRVNACDRCLWLSRDIDRRRVSEELDWDRLRRADCNLTYMAVA